MSNRNYFVTTVGELKIKDVFRKWDGRICTLVEKTSGRARIKLHDVKTKVVEVEFHGEDGPNVVAMKKPLERAEYDVSLGTEVIEVISRGETK